MNFRLRRIAHLSLFRRPGFQFTLSFEGPRRKSLAIDTALAPEEGSSFVFAACPAKFASCIACLAILALISGCGSARPIKYYQISPPPPPPSAQQPLDVRLLVRLPLASHIYREDRIVYTSDSHEFGTYETHRWAEPPAELLQNAIVRGLRASGRFSAVMNQRSDSNGEYLLVSHIYDFSELTGGTLAARLSYDADLRDLKTGRTVWSHSYNHDEPSAGKDLVSLVAAMDKNVQRSVQEIQAGLDDYFKSHPTK